MKRLAKIVGSILLLGFLLIGACTGYMAWQSRLPSDVAAIEYFRIHERDFTSLLAALEREPKLRIVAGDEIGAAGDVNDTGHPSCAQLLKKTGALLLTREGDTDAVLIYVWGTGCTVCHDSYKGFAYVPPSARLLKWATMLPSLEDSKLPSAKKGGIEDGTYLMPLHGNWYVIRLEAG